MPAADAAILDATIELFADLGFEGVSIEAVAERAGVAKSTVYRRYPSKIDLVMAAWLAFLKSRLLLPEPAMPVGWGYSYLDWFGAYNMATAALAALYRRATTGRGCHVDASQADERCRRRPTGRGSCTSTSCTRKASSERL